VRKFESVEALEAFAKQHGGEVPVAAGTKLAVVLPFAALGFGTTREETLKTVLKLGRKGNEVSFQAQKNAPDNFVDTVTLRPGSGSSQKNVDIRIRVVQDWRRNKIDEELPKVLDVVENTVRAVESQFPKIDL
jgi:hypothetical protein